MRIVIDYRDRGLATSARDNIQQRGLDSTRGPRIVTNSRSGIERSTSRSASVGPLFPLNVFPTPVSCRAAPLTAQSSIADGSGTSSSSLGTGWTTTERERKQSERRGAVHRATEVAAVIPLAA